MAKSRAFEPHDHTKCQHSTLQLAEDLCVKRGVKLTPIRRQVLEILLENHKAIGAYDVLKRLEAMGQKPQPPVAYRALDFLVQNGLAHKIQKLNAFIACAHPETDHNPLFMICKKCHKIEESPSITTQMGIESTAGHHGFSIENSVLEVEGTCPNCRDNTQ